METVKNVCRAGELIAPIVERLEREMENALGVEWTQTWHVGLPEWDRTPGEVNVPWILRLRNLTLAYDMIEYGKMRYNMLGNGGHWFPGNKADKMGELDLTAALRKSPNATAIPGLLEEAHKLLGGAEQKRLQEA